MYTVFAAKNLAQHCIIENDFILDSKCDVMGSIRQFATPFGYVPIRLESRATEVGMIQFCTVQNAKSIVTGKPGFAIIPNDVLVPAGAKMTISCSNENVRDGFESVIVEPEFEFEQH